MVSTQAVCLVQTIRQLKELLLRQIMNLIVLFRLACAENVCMILQRSWKVTRREQKIFRFSTVWRKFREVIKKEYGGRDYITGQWLDNTWQLHHINQDNSQYTNLENHSHFLPITKKTHLFLHWFYRIYVKDKTAIVRLKEILDRMETVTNASKSK